MRKQSPPGRRFKRKKKVIIYNTDIIKKANRNQQFQKL